MKSLSLLNKALLCEWSWLFANERGRHSLWRMVIRKKFREVEGGWSNGDIMGGFRTSLWKEL